MKNIQIMENADIAKIFEDIADLLEIKNDNPFRVRSYRNSALVIGGIAETLGPPPIRAAYKIQAIKGTRDSQP